MNFEVITCDCLDYLSKTDRRWSCIFADCPDNLGLTYKTYEDSMDPVDYANKLEHWLLAFIEHADSVWLSFNSRYFAEVGSIVKGLKTRYDIDTKLCVQTFTFGNYNRYDLTNCFRPLLRIRHKGIPWYHDSVRVPSWRQDHGDKRADPRGRTLSDVFDIARVTGNSKQRRKWIPTQLSEQLVKQCLLLSTKPGDTVLDVFSGSGSTMRVCRKTDRNCTALEIDALYCENIATDNMLARVSADTWRGNS